jgi:hypothetical protein
MQRGTRDVISIAVMGFYLKYYIFFGVNEHEGKRGMLNRKKKKTCLGNIYNPVEHIFPLAFLFCCIYSLTVIAQSV